MILFALAGLFGGLGLLMLVSRRTVFGIVLAVHLMGTAMALTFVTAGLISGKLSESGVFSLLVTLVVLAQVVAGYAFAVRLFYLKRRIGVDELRSMKQ